MATQTPKLLNILLFWLLPLIGLVTDEKAIVYSYHLVLLIVSFFWSIEVVLEMSLNEMFWKMGFWI